MSSGSSPVGSGISRRKSTKYGSGRILAATSGLMFSSTARMSCELNHCSSSGVINLKGKGTKGRGVGRGGEGRGSGRGGEGRGKGKGEGEGRGREGEGEGKGRGREGKGKGKGRATSLPNPAPSSPQDRKPYALYLEKDTAPLLR